MEKYKRIKQEIAYRAHVFDVYNDYLELPDGREVVYDLIKHKAGACVLPVMDNGDIVLVKQYRNSIDAVTFEAPAGFIDEGETPDEAAARELREETGYMAEKLIYVTKAVLAIGTSDEQTYIYIGKELNKGRRNLDDNEFIDCERIDILKAEDMIRTGVVVDSKTIIAIYAYKNMILKSNIDKNL